MSSEAGNARATIEALSKPFDHSLIRMKPGSNRRPATPYISHGLCTKRLNEVCPGWSTRLIEVHSYTDGQGVLQCAAVTLDMEIPGLGTHSEVGTANQRRNFGDDLKNAMSDALKRCAMRFGVALDLWEDMDEADEDAHPAQPARTPPASTQPRPAPVALPASPNQQANQQRTIDTEPYDDALDWTAFWKWARPQGYHSKADMAKALGKADSAINDWTPAQLRTALEVAHQRAG